MSLKDTFKFGTSSLNLLVASILLVFTLGNQALAKTEAGKKVEWEEPEHSNVGSAAPNSFSFKLNSTAPASEPAADTEGEFYPDGALKAAYEAQMKEMKKTEEAERQLVYDRDNYERHKFESQEQIAKTKKQIEGYKMRQDKVQEQIEVMQTELVEIDGKTKETVDQLAQLEESGKSELVKNEEVKKQLDTTRNKLKSSLINLARVRDETAAKINKAQIDMQRMRGEIAESEAQISRAENDKVRTESQEIQIRTELSSVASRNRELAMEKTRTLAELNDLKKRLESARRDYAAVKKETDELDREVRNLQAKASQDRTNTLNEMRRLDEATIVASNQRARNEAEKARLASEQERLGMELAIIKQKNQQAVAERSESDSVVMESRLAFETTKADLHREFANYESSRLGNDTRQMKIRNLASLAEQSDMLGSQIVAKAVRACKIRREPSSTADVVGELSKGAKVITAPAEGPWYKLLNTSGLPQFVDESCVKSLSN